MLGPEHPNTALVLENYATLLRKMQREGVAVELEERAQAVRAKLVNTSNILIYAKKLGNMFY